MVERMSILGEPIKWSVPQEPTYEYPTTRHGFSRRVSIPTPPIVRAGVVWSAGPVPGTAWVIPDEREEAEGFAVCVQIDTGGQHSQRPVDVARSTSDAQRSTAHRYRLRREGISAKRGAAGVRTNSSRAS